MSIHLFTVELQHVNGMPEDSTVNGFVVDTALGWDPLSEMGEVSTAIAQFYNEVVPASGTTIAGYLAASLDRSAGGGVIKAYDITTKLDGSPHGSPVGQDTMTLGAQDGLPTQLPSECAATLTLRAAAWDEQPVERPDGADEGTAVDRPRQRYSGRLFLGPLNANAINVSASKVHVHQNLRLAACNSAARLQTALVANGHSWRVWSRQDAVTRLIERAEMDDAFDTQRRRGVAATVRTAVTF